MFNDKYLQRYPMSLPFRFNSKPPVCFGNSYRRTSYSCQRDPVGMQRRNRFVQTDGRERQRVRRIGSFIVRGTRSALLLALHYGFRTAAEVTWCELFLDSRKVSNSSSVSIPEARTSSQCW